MPIFKDTHFFLCCSLSLTTNKKKMHKCIKVDEKNIKISL